MKIEFWFLSMAFICLSSCKNQNSEDIWISKTNLGLENMHQEMLEPIQDLKSSDPKIYWFIVSWLNTNYKTPVWTGYGTKGWKEKTKKRGIDCSGFSRVMLAEMFNKKIRGGSQGIFKNYCKKKNETALRMGDLLFFKSPHSKNKRIVHMGVYLNDGNFVHATSAKSAALGLGLSINSLDENIWYNDLVAVGEVN